jgi:hypothetical protein
LDVSNGERLATNETVFTWILDACHDGSFKDVAARRDTVARTVRTYGSNDIEDRERESRRKMRSLGERAGEEMWRAIPPGVLLSRANTQLSQESNPKVRET